MNKKCSPAPSAPRVIVACRVMEPEFVALMPADNSVEVRYLDQALHMTPDKLTPLLQEQVDAAQKYASKIVLGYGLCANGVAGVVAPKQGLIIPRAHDCIALFLGSRKAYDEAMRVRPGTYYLTPGWVAERKDPLGYMEEKYVPRVGRETAEWALRQELKNYTHIVLINTKAAAPEPLRQRALENARFLNLRYEEVDGPRDYFRKLLCGPYLEKDFIVFQPGEIVSINPFLC